jgi:D-amino peptidase
MRKLLISADMEGCAAVSSQHALWPDRWEWTAARRWMTEEVIVVAKGAFAAGYEEVIAADSHGNAHNIDPDLLPDNVRLVRSWPRPLLQMQGLEDPEVKACAFVGYHAGADSQDGLLSHSFSGAAFRSVRLNGEHCSEGYLNAALAGEFGIPIILVAGDEQAVEDAGRYAPGAVTCITKHAIGWRSQSSLPPAQVRRLLQKAAEQALGGSMPEAFLLKAPYHLELDMVSRVAAEMLAYLPGVERVKGCAVGANFDRLEGVMGFIAFAMLYSPTGTVAL